MRQLPGAVFLDRDNTITVDKGYCHKVAEFQWISGADKALRLLHDADIAVFIVTNQGGIGRGIFSLDDMQSFHNHLHHMTQKAGGKITDIAYCPHHPKALDPAMRHCECRKPSPNMLLYLAEKWQIDLTKSVMIGDRLSDSQAGDAAGCTSYLYDGTLRFDSLVKEIIKTHFSDKQSQP